MSEKTSLLDIPSRRFFATQIVNCIQQENESSGQKVDKWIYCDKSGSSVSFNQVWIQGFIVLVSADGNDILVDDGTGIVHVTGLNKLLKNVSVTKGMDRDDL